MSFNDFEYRCQTITHHAGMLALDVQFCNLGNAFLISDCDLLRAEKDLSESLKLVRAALALRPSAVKKQQEIDANLDALFPRSAA